MTNRYGKKEDESDQDQGPHSSHCFKKKYKERTKKINREPYKVI